MDILVYAAIAFFITVPVIGLLLIIKHILRIKNEMGMANQFKKHLAEYINSEGTLNDLYDEMMEKVDILSNNMQGIGKFAYYKESGFSPIIHYNYDVLLNCLPDIRDHFVFQEYADTKLFQHKVNWVNDVLSKYIGNLKNQRSIQKRWLFNPLEWISTFTRETYYYLASAFSITPNDRSKKIGSFILNGLYIMSSIATIWQTVVIFIK